MGGGGMGFGEEALLFERFGRELLPAPFLVASALARPALEADHGALQRMIAGELVPTLAWAEPGGPSTLAAWEATECRAVRAQDGWRLTGRKDLVADLALCTHAVVLARGDDGVAAFLVYLDEDGVRAESPPAVDGTRRYGTLTLDAAAAAPLTGPDELDAVMRDIRARAHAALAWEAVGVARHALDLAVEHARTREQFGRPIGFFQGVAHPLAQRYVEIELARALADCAARAIDAGEERSQALLSPAAVGAAADAAVATCETAIQVLGAMGFTWDHPLHRLLRRARWIQAFDGGAVRRRQDIAALLLTREPDEAAPLTVELYDGPEEAEARSAARAWIAENLPTAKRGLDLIRSEAELRERAARWSQLIADGGHAHSWWPAEHGGADAVPIRAAIFRGEAVRRHPRPDTASTGLDLVSSMLLRYGTPGQCARYLPGIADESEIWAQGFSEPGAGSDLAAIRMRATRDGDGWILEGTKIWSSFGPVADRYFLLARTDPDSVRHRGLSCFTVDVDQPGVRTQPITAISGEVEFSQVFFDGVRVGADALLGPENEGWRIAIATLAFERLTNISEPIGDVDFMFDRLLDTVRGGETAEAADARVRDRIGGAWSALMALKVTEYRSMLALKQADVPPPESGIIKLVFSEVGQDVAALGFELLGARGQVLDPEDGLAAFWTYRYLDSRAHTIYSGSSEILRGVIAEHVLGLPRGR
jgi:alkylation response protein AidB-like acyl-CoA dehydrogenase